MLMYSILFRSIPFLFIFPEISGVTFSNSQHEFILPGNRPEHITPSNCHGTSLISGSPVEGTESPAPHTSVVESSVLSSPGKPGR